MSMLRAFSWPLGGAFALVVVAGVSASTDETSALVPGLSDNGLRRRFLQEFCIGRVLSQPVQLEFIETPLQDVVDYLSDSHGVEIQIDVKALDDRGVGMDHPITINLKGVSLRSALRLILREPGLTCGIQDEVLLITTSDMVAKRSVTKLYPVGDLLTEGDSVKSLERAVAVVLDAPLAEKREAESAPHPRLAGFRDHLILHAPESEHEKVRELLRRLRMAMKLVTPQVVHPLVSLGSPTQLDFRHIALLDEDLVYLREAKQLETLDLSKSRITDQGLAHLSGLTNLKRLNLTGTRVTSEGLNHLSAMLNLEYLDLSSTWIKEDGLRHLKPLARLQTLKLDHTRICDVKHLEAITALQELSLGDTMIDDAGVKTLARLSSLTTLNLGTTPITDKALEELAAMKNLKVLRLDRFLYYSYSHGPRPMPSFSLEASEKLRRALPNCRITGLPMKATKDKTQPDVDPFGHPGEDPFAPRPEPAAEDPFGDVPARESDPPPADNAFGDGKHAFGALK